MARLGFLSLEIFISTPGHRANKTEYIVMMSNEGSSKIVNSAFHNPEAKVHISQGECLNNNK